MTYAYEIPILEDGRVTFENVALKKGMTVKLTIAKPRRVKTAGEKAYLKHLRLLQESYAKDNPFNGMTQEEILAELRRQRDEWDAVSDAEWQAELDKLRQEWERHK